MNDWLSVVQTIFARFIPPSTNPDLLVDQFVMLITYVSIMTIRTRMKKQAQNLGKLIISAINGMTLPLALVLFTLPLYPRNHALLDTATVTANLMVAGFIGLSGSLWILFTDP